MGGLLWSTFPKHLENSTSSCHGCHLNISGSFHSDRKLSKQKRLSQCSLTISWPKEDSKPANYMQCVYNSVFRAEPCLNQSHISSWFCLYTHRHTDTQTHRHTDTHIYKPNMCWDVVFSSLWTSCLVGCRWGSWRRPLSPCCTAKRTGRARARSASSPWRSAHTGWSLVEPQTPLLTTNPSPLSLPCPTLQPPCCSLHSDPPSPPLFLPGPLAWPPAASQPELSKPSDQFSPQKPQGPAGVCYDLPEM